MLAIVPPQRAVESKHQEEDQNGKHSVAAVGLLFCLHDRIDISACVRLMHMHQPTSMHRSTPLQSCAASVDASPSGRCAPCTGYASYSLQVKQ